MKQVETKSVGKDEITAEWIKINRDWVAPIITTILNNWRDNKNTPMSWMGGIITLMRKNDSRENPDSYRPIALISIIYNILAIAMNNKIASLPNLIA